jgi:5-methylcytosine-specific restriction endonuclease McrA
MSKTWAKGTTRAWGHTRRLVLARDGYQCQLRLPGCTITAPLKGGHVHHTHGRSITGDDPAHLVAACAHCNLTTGDPTRAPDPAPRPRTRW